MDKTKKVKAKAREENKGVYGAKSQESKNKKGEEGERLIPKLASRAVYICHLAPLKRQPGGKSEFKQSHHHAHDSSASSHLVASRTTVACRIEGSPLRFSGPD